MKKALYILLLAVEFVLGSLFLSFIAIYTGWTFLFLAFAVWAVLSGLLLAKLKKADDAKQRSKLKIFLALVMLIPLVVGIATFTFFVIALSMYI